MNKLIKTLLYCDKCGRCIIRPENKTWKEVLDKNGWKWCAKLGITKRLGDLYCGYCTYIFEKKNNIDPKTGMT